MTASNHTYSTRSSHPSKGTGTPHASSRVMARERNPSRHAPLASSATHRRDHAAEPEGDANHSPTAASSRSNRRNSCRCGRNEATSPHTRHRASTSSSGSRERPHSSHWSPRAPENEHHGHVPSTYRSGR